MVVLGQPACEECQEKRNRHERKEGPSISTESLPEARGGARRGLGRAPDTSIETVDRAFGLRGDAAVGAGQPYRRLLELPGRLLKLL